MLGKKLINAGPVSSGANTFASENFNTVLYTGNGSTQRIGGYINRGAVFNGSSSKIVLPSGSPFNDSNTIKAVSMWFRLTTTSSNLYGFSVGSDNSGSYFFNLYISGSSIGGQVRNGGSSNQSTMAATWTADTDWHHVVWQLGSTEKEIYLDGNKLSVTFTNTGTSNDTSWIDYPSYSGNVVGQIGVNRATASFSYSNGLKDQVRFFNKALSSSEVTTLYGETHASTTISTTDIFSDNSGVALYQLDGNANDTGGASGKFGAGGIFNGSSSKIDTGITNITSEIAVSGWVYINDNSTSQHIFSSCRTNATSYSEFPFGITIESGNIVFFTATNNDYTRDSEFTQAVSAGNWYHFVANYKANTSVSFYVNNSLVGETNINYTVSQNNRNYIIGSSHIYNTSHYFNGKIDDLRIYTTMLTATEVGYLYNNTTASIPTSNLLTYYKLDGDARDEQQLYDGVATNVTYAYDGTATNVTYQEATKFQPDLVWIKERGTAQGHRWYDSVRGETKHLNSENNAIEATNTGGLTSFDTNGFSLGSYAPVNENNATYAAWCFKGGGTAVSNIDGNITSSVSANQDAGFSIVTWTSDGSTGLEVGHGLAQQPELIINKRYSGSTSNWNVYTDVIDGSWDLLRLNLTNAKSDSADTQASPSLIRNTSTSGSFVAYCFHSVDGYSKVGTYTGTGLSSGNMIETGFQPAWLIIKRTDTTSEWTIFDNKRDSVNPNEAFLEANTSDAEATGRGVNFLSNGFEWYGTSQQVNASGGTYIYLAIAADPDTTTPTVENSFDVVTYEGDGTTNHQIDVDFKPDMVFGKNRGSTGENWFLIDSIRENGGRILYPNLTNAQSSSGYFTLNNDGFTINTTNNNVSGNDYVAFAFKAGDHDDNLPQINTEGSIDSVVSVNAEAGFSIVKYTGNGNTSQQSYGHGLSQAPELVINKAIDSITQGTNNWVVGGTILGAGGYMFLNSTNAKATASSYNGNQVPDSSVVYISGTSDLVHNQSGKNFISYCFHSVSGYQKIGSYTGNGSTTGTVVTTGFEPRFVMLKRTDSTGSWRIMDSVRDTDPIIEKNLSANTSDAENDGTDRIQFTSTGFQLKTSNVDFNANNGEYIYLAIK